MGQFDIEINMGSYNKNLQVFYAVENRVEECLQIFRCRINAPNTQLTEWLSPGKFDLVTHIREGVQLVDYAASFSALPDSPKTDEFIYKVYAEIHFREFRRKAGQYPEC
jgi:hypothetical protein